MAGNRSGKNIYQKLTKIQNEIDYGNRMQKRIFWLALAGSLIILANTYYPFIMQKMGWDSTNFYVQNFSGFVGLAVFCLIYGILSTRRSNNTRIIKKVEDKSHITEYLITLSISLFSLALLNKSLGSSESISGLSKTITSWWYYIGILGLVLLVFGVYFKLPNHKLQQWLINNVFFSQIVTAIKMLSWAIILFLFGHDLVEIMQATWATVVGLLCMLVGSALVCLGFMYCIVMGVILSRKSKVSAINP